MRRKTLGLAISSILAPSLSYALGLGEISTNSALNQPLDAEIELVSTTPAEVDNVTVKLAPNAVFDQVGIERTALLDGLRFSPTVVNGVPVIKVTSNQGIQEPFINFVIEVAWPKGKLLREYTVLLDPPVLSDNVGMPPAVAAAPFTAPPVAAAPVPAAIEAMPVEAMPAPELPPMSMSTPQTYPVAEAVQSMPAQDIFVAPPVAIPDVAGVDSIPMSQTFPVEEALQPVEPMPQYAGSSEVFGGSDVFVSPVEPVSSTDAYSAEGLSPFVDGAAPAPVAMADSEVLPLDADGTFDTSVFESAEPIFTGSVSDADFNAQFASGREVMPLAEAPGTSDIFVSSPSPAFNDLAFEDAQPLEEPTFVSAAPFEEDLVPGYAGGDGYSVNRGDTLSQIAGQLRPNGVSLNRMMAAFVESNPSAFINSNMHKLKSGYVLRIPDEAQLAAVDEARANAIIARSGGAWKQYKQQLAQAPAPQAAMDAAVESAPATPSTAAGLDNLAAAAPREVEVTQGSALEIVAPTGAGDSAQGSATADANNAQTDLLNEQLESKTREADELRSRVSELEALLAAKDRLIDLKDQQLAELQSNLDETRSAAEDAAKAVTDTAADAANTATDAASAAVSAVMPEAEKADATPAVTETEQPVATETEAPVAEQPATDAAVEPAVTEAAAQPAPSAEAAPVADTTETAEGSNPRNLLLGGGAGLLLLALLAWWSSRRKNRDDEALYDDAELDQVKTTFTEKAVDVPEPEMPEVDAEISTQNFENVDLDLEETNHSIQLNADELKLDDAEEIGEDLTAVDIDVNDDEVLSEANVYLAYGLHDQAIDLLKPMVEAHPERVEYQAKLLEAYHATGDKTAFQSLSEKMHNNLRAGDEALWQRAAVMGKDLMPDNDLYSDVDTGDLTLSNIRKDRPDINDLNLDDMPDLEDAQETLSIRKEELGGDLSEEFNLPELEDLDQSINRAGDELSLAEADLSQQINVDDLGDLDSSLASVSDSQMLEDENLTLADMESELSELSTGVDHIGTKLDLAKAYIDMGDEEGAREALSEVISQGDATQQDEAKKLLEQLS